MAVSGTPAGAGRDAETPSVVKQSAFAAGRLGYHSANPVKSGVRWESRLVRRSTVIRTEVWWSVLSESRSDRV